MVVYRDFKLLKLSYVGLITFEIQENTLKTQHKADFWSDRYFLHHSNSPHVFNDVWTPYSQYNINLIFIIITLIFL